MPQCSLIKNLIKENLHKKLFPQPIIKTPIFKRLGINAESITLATKHCDPFSLLKLYFLGLSLCIDTHVVANKYFRLFA